MRLSPLQPPFPIVGSALAVAGRAARCRFRFGTAAQTQQNGGREMDTSGLAYGSAMAVHCIGNATFIVSHNDKLTCKPRRSSSRVWLGGCGVAGSRMAAVETVLASCFVLKVMLESSGAGS